MSGNVLEERYRVISLQFESLRHLANATEQWAPTEPSDVARANPIDPSGAGVTSTTFQL